jgi:hypothetical protein
VSTDAAGRWISLPNVNGEDYFSFFHAFQTGDKMIMVPDPDPILTFFYQRFEEISEKVQHFII